MTNCPNLFWSEDIVQGWLCHGILCMNPNFLMDFPQSKNWKVPPWVSHPRDVSDFYEWHFFRASTHPLMKHLRIPSSPEQCTPLCIQSFLQGKTMGTAYTHISWNDQAHKWFAECQLPSGPFHLFSLMLLMRIQFYITVWDGNRWILRQLGRLAVQTLQAGTNVSSISNPLVNCTCHCQFICFWFIPFQLNFVYLHCDQKNGSLA